MKNLIFFENIVFGSQHLYLLFECQRYILIFIIFIGKCVRAYFLQIILDGFFQYNYITYKAV